MNSIQLTGYLAGFIIAVSLAPQVSKAWKTKSTADISLLWNVIYIFGLVLFQIYAFGINEMPLIITNTVELVLAGALIAAKFIYK
ncbi:MAG: PQ-loop domain-containing transporter [Parcubacteria group bacterium]|jgi:MtN3 and saliva related transmembrane protein